MEIGFLGASSTLKVPPPYRFACNACKVAALMLGVVLSTTFSPEVFGSKDC